jgi:hypothetical protein
MTDYEKGYQTGKLGAKSNYPNNANYVRGFQAGTVWLMRQVELDRPIDNMMPSGTNDANIDFNQG